MTSNAEVQALIEEAEETAQAIRSKQAVGPNDARRIEALAAALSALSSPAETEVTSFDELFALPNDAVIRDSMGDIGVVGGTFVHYPETNPVAFEKVAKHYLPAHVIYMPEVVQ